MTYFLEIDGYKLFQLDGNWSDKPGNIKKGGGLCAYIRNDLLVSPITYQHLNISTQHAEKQWLSFKNKFCKDIIVATCYRPPTGNIEQFINTLENSITTLNLQKNYVFILGDMNLDLSLTNCNDSKKLKSTFEQLGFIQLIKDPNNYGRNNSIIDVIYCTIKENSNKEN